jgi:hypothetical protein
MNANELADELEAFHVDPDGFPYMIGEAITMLRQFGLAESIIKQQQLEIQALKDEVAEWKMSYENCHRMCSGYGMN